MPLERFKFIPNFTLDEFKCKCGAPVPVEFHSNVVDIAANLQVLRDEFKKPIKINSGYRTVDYNHRSGGSLNSHHLRANAADFQISGYDTQFIALVMHKLMLEGKMAQGGIGIYGTFIHYDLRGYYQLFKL